MSSAVLPAFPGIAYPVTRTPVFSTLTQGSISGKENRIATQSYPRWKWDLSYNLLRSSAAFAEYQALVGFFNSRQGMFDAFLYQDADDNAVTGQPIGEGNGVQTNFQLVRTFGGFTEPVLAPNAINNIYLNGTLYNPATLAAPGACTLTMQAGSGLAATTYYVRATWNTPTGETLAGAESSLAVPANHQLIVTPPVAPAGATGWVPFVSNTAGGGSGAETSQTFGSLSTSSSWGEPGAGLVSGYAMPSSNTTGAEVTLWGAGSSQGPGVLLFNGAPASGQLITADFSYYWPCRMSTDDLATSLFMSQYYEVKKFSFISVKN